MQSVTFVGEVQGGRLHIQQSLGDFEGKRVVVTVTAAEAASLQDAREIIGTGSATRPVAAPEAEILEDSGRIRLPRPSTALTAQVMSAGRRTPRISTEED